jgi:hypothetical protein
MVQSDWMFALRGLSHGHHRSTSDDSVTVGLPTFMPRMIGPRKPLLGAGLRHGRVSG